MNVLVVGGGYLGRKVAERLDMMGHDVSVIEEQAGKIAAFSPDFGGITFKSFPMDIKNLVVAGIERCDAVLVTTSDDNLNITVGQIAKNIFHKTNVVSRISDPVRENIFEEFGLKTVCPTNMASESMIASIVKDFRNENVYFSSTVLGFEEVLADKRDIGKYAKDIVCSEDKLVLGLIKGNKKFILANNNLKVEDGDKIVYVKKVD